MFRNDYSETAPKEVLRALLEMENEQNVGYGMDSHSAHAKELIRKTFGSPDADVHFLAGGTQTNMTVISYFLRPYEGVITCDTAHINVHETAAVEASGHKVWVCPNRDGKLLAGDVERAVRLHTDEHMMKPAMVYVSDATETGTVYTRAELTSLRRVCDRYGLLLFLDGARLGSALTCGATDTDPAFLAGVCDVFYIGGTKNGLLYGEAVVIPDPAKAADFRYHIKNRGAMLAKGFVVGAQFEALFTDGLFFRLAQNANDMAARIRRGITALGIPMDGNSPTNQIFLRLPAAVAERMTDAFGCEKWKDLGEETVIRAVTSFATTADECDEFLQALGDAVREGAR